MTKVNKHQLGNEFSIENIIELGNDLSTFKLRGYEIEEEMALHPETKEPIFIEEIFGEIRNVRDSNKEIIAKRKNPSDQLRTVRKRLKITAKGEK